MIELTTKDLDIAHHAMALTYMGWHRQWDKDDIESASMWGLYKASLTYDPSRGASFPTYARNKCVWAIKKFMIEDEAKRNRRVTKLLGIIPYEWRHMAVWHYPNRQPYHKRRARNDSVVVNG